MLLSEIWDTDNFHESVNHHTQEFRALYRLPPIFQLGLVVEDVEQSARELEARGIGPFLIMEGKVNKWNERGMEHHFRGKMGLAYYQGIQLELLEPGIGSDFYRQSLDPAGGITIQHLGFAVDDIEAWGNVFIQKNLPVWVRGKMQSGPLAVDFIYLDTATQAGFVVEFLCWKLLGHPFLLPRWVAHGMGRLEKLSGKRSITT